MKFIDEVDIELVNQELNFHSPDNNLTIKGGCDLFTTKAIGSDRKLFKTIDKHLDQIMEDQLLSQSLDRERKQSVHSLLGSSASPQQPHFWRRGSLQPELFDRPASFSDHLASFHKSDGTLADGKAPVCRKLAAPSLEDNGEESAIDESPFGPLRNTATRKTFAYLIAILNTTYPDHDFSNLQPSTENFYRVDSAESLRHRFNSIMVSLGKKEDLLSWVWDTINAYMDLVPSRSPSLAAQGGAGSRKNSFNQPHAGSPGPMDPAFLAADTACKIYEFQPSDQSILEDLHHPFQTLWSNYWFIYNKKKKRVCFLYLTAITRGHHLQIARTATPPVGMDSRGARRQRAASEDSAYHDDYDENMDDASMGADEEDDALTDDVVGDIEI
ncbi:repressor of RNA polymerase III transcription MAF1 [Metschnikowia bicuspidata var. bicuspidata NRRL YB-4993]|uniref:Repressor of RNA polymerase III transcription MAF1 n=1 Tax=Metschnikowia bicuspidata var. bicuspidata NRRL YB-4993 TaxID=869754 RepID=A0A1A0H6M5_9ASCO|nr:repressor of RNA polymerase III transcription MAF1 [Metschnikowia bicuspidata var. bicuspidata NRRL YB-4993]OBA19563.1 repressor of RNA polymerase III transcription MAF1 [Metschnikowia bicuspidata var. bicuspidata NRRL YB-4993]